MPNVKSVQTVIMEFEPDGTFKEASGQRLIVTDEIFENRSHGIRIAEHFTREDLLARSQALRDAMALIRNEFSLMMDDRDAVKP